jgi:hypothetical protein
MDASVSAAPSERRAEALITRRSAITVTVLTLFFVIMGYLDFPAKSGPLVVLRMASVGWSLWLLAMLIRQGTHPGLWFSRVVVGLAPLPLLPIFWLTAQEHSIRNLPLELFIRENVCSVVWAVVAPPNVAVSAAVIVAFSSQSLILFWWGGIPLDRPITRMEPWTTLFVGFGSLLLAFYRAHRQRGEVRMIVAAERATALAQLARAFLAVRDLANTPLQTIEVALALLSERYPAAGELTIKIEHSLIRLRDLNEVLANKAAETEWRSGDESFDSMSVIQQLRKD